MTLTRDWRRGLAITFAVLAALSVMVVGNQRHAQAQTLADEILCDVEEELNDEGLPFDFEQDECGEEDDDGETPVPSEDPQCSDGIDNDNDGKTDWEPEVVGDGDPGCSTPTDDDESDDPSEGGGDESACEDGEDNDGDGKVDMNDPGCTDSQDDDETDQSGGGGTNDNACEDGEDNDNDGKVDMDDPGCTDSNDDDETDPSGGDSGGNGDSSSGGGSGGGSRRTNGEVLGDATCSEYLTAYLRMGRQNDAEQVRRLQFVLKEMEGFDLELTGVYDAATLAAVNAFQVRYAADILTPWGISAPTGYTYLTTRKKVNEVYCKGTVSFPLTDSEQQIIQKTRAQGTPAGTVAEIAKDTPAPAAQTTVIEPLSGTAAVGNATTTSERRGFWGGIRDFFRGVFGRD